MENSAIPSLFYFQEIPIEFILCYLYKHQAPDVQAFLVNKLYNNSIEEILNFLPQLVNLSIRREDYGAYSAFFINCCQKSHFFAMRLFWILNAQYEGLQQTKFIRKLRNLIDKIEEVIITGSKSETQEEIKHLYNLPIEQTEEFKIQRKLIRGFYSWDQNSLALSLTNINIYLIQVPDLKKDITLQAYIKNLDTWIKHQRFQYSDQQYSEYTKRLYRGIVLPVQFSDQGGTIEQIVRIPYQEAVCFKTKARVPYRIVLQTVDIMEPVQQEISCQLSTDLSTQNLQELDQARFQDLKKTNQEKRGVKNESCGQELPWGQKYEETFARIRRDSPFSHYKSWKLRSLIVKGPDNLQQEFLAMQIIKKSRQIFQQRQLNLYLRPYDILVINSQSGLIECIPQCASIHTIKKQHTSLFQYFNSQFFRNFEEAQRNFVQSLAGYSLISYILNLKDRHNGNILINSQGRLIHIDFGFFLSNSPGGLNFQTAPFKLTKEMIELMGGYVSEMFTYYKVLMYQGFIALRKYSQEFTLMIQMMKPGDNLPCFVKQDKAVKEFRKRFHLHLNDDQCLKVIDHLVEVAAENKKTVRYDSFQKISNGILY